MPFSAPSPGVSSWTKTAFERSAGFFLIQPDAKTLPQGGFGHRLQQKIVCTQPEGMERKIQIAAPDNTCLGTKRAQMLYCIQAVDTRQGDHGVCQRLAACGFKKTFLIVVTVHLGKQTMLGAELQDLLCQKSFLRPAVCQHGDSVHSFPPFSSSLIGGFCLQYTDRRGLFKVSGTKALFPSRNPVFCCDRTVQLCYNQDERVYKGGWKL